MFVSAVCPTHNRATWLPLAIECFLGQTHTECELVILDNGTDDTESIVPVNPLIRYERVPGARLRTGEMRNRVNALARGEVICHWDSDDWSAPERIEIQLKQLQESGKPFVGFHVLSFWDTTPLLGNATAEDRAYRYIGDRPYTTGTSQMYFKSYWEKNKFLNASIGEDSEFSTRAKAAGQLASFDGSQIIVARAHTDSTSPAPLHKNSPQFPRVPLNELPERFLRAIGLQP